jgi:hypothetical protein
MSRTDAQFAIRNAVGSHWAGIDHDTVSVVSGGNRPRWRLLFGGRQAAAQWKRGCYNQQKL